MGAPVFALVHALQGSRHASSQHTPSTQKPSLHWLGSSQALPTFRATQLPSWQTPATEMQSLNGSVPLGTKPHSPVGVAHVMQGASHAVEQQVLSTQNDPVWHWFVVLHSAPSVLSRQTPAPSHVPPPSHAVVADAFAIPHWSPSHDRKRHALSVPGHSLGTQSGPLLVELAVVPEPPVPAGSLVQPVATASPAIVSAPEK
jgi:hypothetical protein